jgi:general secretion pathway protein L
VTGAEFVQRLRRADLVEGLGVYVAPTSLALAHVRKRVFQVSVQATEVSALPGVAEPDRRGAAFVSAVTRFVEEHHVDTRRASLVLPRTLAMFNRVLLPLAASENLAQVLEYEIENLIPMPRDEVHYDFSWRPHGDERIEVLLMCLPLAVVREYLDLLAQADVHPRRITLASVALAEYAAFCANGSGRVTGLLVNEGEAMEVALVRAGRLLTSQFLPAFSGQTEDVLGVAIGRVLGEHRVKGDEVQFWSWGVDGTPEVSGFGSAPLAELTQEHFEGPATWPVGALPAVGAGLAAVREGSVSVNLLPSTERGGSEDGLSLATLALVGVMGVLLLVWGVSALVKDELLRRSVNADVAAIVPQVEEVRRLQDEIANLNGQIEILASGDDARATDLLSELTELIPSDAYLTTLTLRAGRVTMDGHAKSASDIITALEKSKRFKKVSFSSPTTRAGDQERFALVAELAR